MELGKQILRTSYFLFHNHLALRSCLTASQINYTKIVKKYCTSSKSSSSIFSSEFTSGDQQSSHDVYDSGSSSDFSDEESGDESDDERKYVAKFLQTKTFKNQTIDDFKPYLKNDKEVERFELILKVYEIVKYDTGLCPSELSIHKIPDLLDIKSTEELTQYLLLLYRVENSKQARRLRREDNRAEVHLRLKYAKENDIPLKMGINFDPESGKPIYGKWRNSMFIDLGKKHEITAFLPQMLAAKQFGQKLVVDFGYENCMQVGEQKSLVRQLTFGFKYIRESENQFDFWFCNLDPQSRLHNSLSMGFGWNRDALYSPYFINQTKVSYLDLFPREKIIYLCPDAQTDMQEFDDESVYIIGGLVDKSIVKPVSLAKCKKEGLKCVKFPLSQYLPMNGSKILTLDQVILTLVRLKEGKSMKEALEESVPSRKIKKPEQIAEEREKRLRKINLQKNVYKTLFTIP